MLWDRERGRRGWLFSLGRVGEVYCVVCMGICLEKIDGRGVSRHMEFFFFGEEVSGDWKYCSKGFVIITACSIGRSLFG